MKPTTPTENPFDFKILKSGDIETLNAHLMLRFTEELENPLRTLLHMTEMLAKENDNPKYTQYIDHMKDSANTLKKIIHEKSENYQLIHKS